MDKHYHDLILADLEIILDLSLISDQKKNYITFKYIKNNKIQIILVEIIFKPFFKKKD